MRKILKVVTILISVFFLLNLEEANAGKKSREDLTPRCQRRCKRIKRARDGYRTGFRYKHSDIGGGVVALTDEYNDIHLFIEARKCRAIETTSYWGVANGNRHHYYTARGKKGAETPKQLARKARRKTGTKKGYFKVGKICYGPFDLSEGLD